MPEIPINSKAFPHLRTAVGDTPIQWDFGSMYAIQLTASLIRIDANQIQWHNHGRFHASGLWTPLRCLPARSAFCSIVQDEPEESVLVFGGTVIGMLIAAQVLLSLELNNTIDSPFLVLYVSLFGIRNFLKFLNLVLLHYKRVDHSTKKQVDNSTRLKKTCELLSDVFVFGALVVIGIQVSVNSTEEYMSSAGTVLLISVLGGTLAHSITLLHLE